MCGAIDDIIAIRGVSLSEYKIYLYRHNYKLKFYIDRGVARSKKNITG